MGGRSAFSANGIDLEDSSTEPWKRPLSFCLHSQRVALQTGNALSLHLPCPGVPPAQAAKLTAGLTHQKIIGKTFHVKSFAGVRLQLAVCRSVGLGKDLF